MKIRAIFITIALFVASAAFAQQQQQQKTPEQQAKEFREALDKRIDDLTLQLKLEDWQIFYIDSIYTHDYTEMQKEQQKLVESRVENPNLYVNVSDKWMERMYQSMKKVLTPEQWAKFNKSGAAVRKKERDKRAGIVTDSKKKK